MTRFLRGLAALAPLFTTLAEAKDLPNVDVHYAARPSPAARTVAPTPPPAFVSCPRGR